MNILRLILKILVQRGVLILLVGQRRRFLKYLKRTDEAKYKEFIDSVLDYVNNAYLGYV